MDKIFRNKVAIAIFIAPGILLFTAVLLVPICQAVYYSLCDWNALSAPKFVGLANFKELFYKDKTMRMALRTPCSLCCFLR